MADKAEEAPRKYGWWLPIPCGYGAWDKENTPVPEHSPEPWKVEPSDEHEGRYEIDHCADGSVTGCNGLFEQDAQRIVACVNACRHLPADYLQYLADEDRFLVGTSLRNVATSIAAYEKLVGENRLRDIGIAAARLVD